jgi:hypothetical protein
VHIHGIDVSVDPAMGLVMTEGAAEAASEASSARDSKKRARARMRNYIIKIARRPSV